jgi:hypothetical protein
MRQPVDGHHASTASSMHATSCRRLAPKSICRSTTVLGDAGLTGLQIMSLSAHETPAAARVYVKRTEVQRMAAARKRRQFVYCRT